MSKHNPNQNFYKTGGRAQTDGPDRGEHEQEQDKREFATVEKKSHPAVQRSSKKK